MSTRCYLLKSTKRELASKKSAPSKGWDTSAMMNSHLYFFVVKHSGMVHTPYVLLVLPLAATSGGPGCLVRVSSPVAGKACTDSSSRVNKKNGF